MKFLFLLFIPFFLFGEVFFEGDSGVKVSISSRKINLDQDFKLQIQMTGEVDKDDLRKSVMMPNSNGIYPLFLAKESEEKTDNKTTLTYLLKPQYPGEITLQLQLGKLLIPPLNLEVAAASSYTTSFPSAPLMPLVKGDPLELELGLRKILYQNSHAKDNVDIIRSHSYPWGRAFGAVLLMLFAPFALAYLLQNHPSQRKEKLKERNPLAELKALQDADPRALSFKIGELFKGGFEPILHKETSAMTFQELLRNLQGQKVNEAEVKRVCYILENIQFQEKSPTESEAKGALKEVVDVLEALSK